MLTAANQPVHYLLQFSQPCWATSKEDHWGWVLMFLHPCKDVAVTSEQSIPWLQKWSLSKPCLLRYPLDFSVSDFPQVFNIVCMHNCRSALCLRWLQHPNLSFDNVLSTAFPCEMSEVRSTISVLIIKLFQSLCGLRCAHVHVLHIWHQSWMPKTDMLWLIGFIFLSGDLELASCICVWPLFLC